MAPRGFTLPPASTSSAKAFRSAFFCELCSKGYSRQNEYDAHESSYDHQHKKRLKEMKSMQKQAQQPSKREEKGPLVQIKLGGGGKSGGAGEGEVAGGKKGGFKKGGFKSAFGAGEGDEVSAEVKKEPDAEEVQKKDDAQDSDDTDDDDYYDPLKPTGCMPGCQGRVGPLS